MASPSSYRPSFSPARKWAIAFNVMVATAAVFLILIGANYISHRFAFKRFYLSTNSRIQLSPRTIGLLHSLTNNVEAIIYYDKNDPLYGDITDLLKEYKAHTPKLNVRTIDYYTEPTAAQELQLKYKELAGRTNRDFIIFDCDGRRKAVEGSSLSDYHYGLERSNDPNDPRLRVNRQRTAFSGEQHFSAAIFAVTQAKPLNAYFLQGHHEHSPNDMTDDTGYGKLASVFHRNYVNTPVLNGLLGTNSIPTDCNLLVISGPRDEFSDVESNKVAEYLNQGGRLLALFDITSTNRNIGLEDILAKWNVRVSHSIVVDPDNQVGKGGPGFFAISGWGMHDVTKPVMSSRIVIVYPRPVGRIKASSSSAVDEPQVTELAFSGTNSFLTDNTGAGQHFYPLMAAVERNAAKGVSVDRGTTRMLIAGDSLFLDNQLIDQADNEDFADSAINWLLNRTELLAGIGSRPVVNYQVKLVQKQVGEVKGILLGAIPGGILLFGGLVWLRRRK